MDHPQAEEDTGFGDSWKLPQGTPTDSNRPQGHPAAEIKTFGGQEAHRIWTLYANSFGESRTILDQEGATWGLRRRDWPPTEGRNFSQQVTTEEILPISGWVWYSLRWWLPQTDKPGWRHQETPDLAPRHSFYSHPTTPPSGGSPSQSISFCQGLEELPHLRRLETAREDPRQLPNLQEGTLSANLAATAFPNGSYKNQVGNQKMWMTNPTLRRSMKIRRKSSRRITRSQRTMTHLKPTLDYSANLNFKWMCHSCNYNLNRVCKRNY